MANVGAWWNSLTPATQQALALTASKGAEGYFANKGEDERQNYARSDSAITNQSEGIRSLMNSEAADYQNRQNRDASAATNAAEMAGSSPLQFQSQRMQMSAMKDLLGGAGQHSFTGMPSHISKHMPQGSAMTPFSSMTMNFASPGAMSAAEGDYFGARSNIDPRLKSPDLGAVGYGTAGTGVTDSLEQERAARLAERKATDDAYDTQAKARKEALQASLARLGPNGTDAQAAAAEQDKGIDWKKWGTVAAGLGAGAYLGSR